MPNQNGWLPASRRRELASLLQKKLTGRRATTFPAAPKPRIGDGAERRLSCSAPAVRGAFLRVVGYNFG